MGRKRNISKPKAKGRGKKRSKKRGTKVGTQKTRLGKGSEGQVPGSEDQAQEVGAEPGAMMDGPPGDPNFNPPEQELLVADEESPISDDAFLPSDPNNEEQASVPSHGLGERKLRKITTRELMAEHEREVGGPIFEKHVEPSTPGSRAEKRLQKEEAQRQAAEELMPEWLQDKTQAGQAAPPTNSPPVNRETTKEAAPNVGGASSDEAAEVLGILAQKAAKAQAEGDLSTAREIRDTISKVSSSYQVRRDYKPKKRHPVMQKLLKHLGLEKIETPAVDWAGFKWHCMPANMILDMWLANTLWEDRQNIALLKVATTVVGVDGTPMYDFMAIPTTHTYLVQEEDEKGNTIEAPITVTPFPKYCSTCGAEIQLSDESCSNCRASQNPMDMPVSLRVTCAERLYHFFLEEFGPAENLVVLMGEIRNLMKDRVADSEELFPLAQLSTKAPKTDSSQPGLE
jgi:hypothetical protein